MKVDDERNPFLNKNSEGRIPPIKAQFGNQNMSKGPYVIFCTFNRNNSVTLSRKRKFKVAISFRLTASRIRPMNCVFDLRFGSNILQKDSIEPDWRSSIRIFDSPQLRSAAKQRVEIVGAFVLHV